MSEGIAENHTVSFNGIKEEGQSLFSLKRSNSSPTAPFILVDFSLPSPLKEDPFFTSINLIPTFNRDRKFYTPSFVLGSELNKYAGNDEGYRMVHQKKIQEMEEQRAEIFVPKPSKANSYCCICREPFEDYLTHINIPRHRELMKKSPYYSMIEELCGGCNGSSGQDAKNRTESEKTDSSVDQFRPLIIKKRPGETTKGTLVEDGDVGFDTDKCFNISLRGMEEIFSRVILFYRIRPNSIIKFY